MKTEKGSGTSIEKRDEGKCEREGNESQQPERRSTGIEIPERNSSRFPLLRRSVDSCRFVLLPLSSSQPHFKPVPRSRFGISPPPAFSPSLSNIHRVSVRGEGRANGQSVARFFFAARINPLHATKKESRVGEFSAAKNPAVYLS